MHQTIFVPILIALLLAPATAHLLQSGTATPSNGAATIDVDASTLSETISAAEAPNNLPGNDDTGIELVAWEDFYGQSLENAVGAWVMTGSPDLPISSLIVFATPENAQSGIAEYRRDSASSTVGALELWSVADRGKWVCIAADGPLLIMSQAEPQPGESDEDVQQRSCDAVVATHDWVLDQLSGNPAATPGTEATPDA